MAGQKYKLSTVKICIFCTKIYANSVHSENNTIKTIGQSHWQKWLCCTISLNAHSTAIAQSCLSTGGNVLKLDLKIIEKKQNKYPRVQIGYQSRLHF